MSSYDQIKCRYNDIVSRYDQLKCCYNDIVCRYDHIVSGYDQIESEVRLTPVGFRSILIWTKQCASLPDSTPADLK